MSTGAVKEQVECPKCKAPNAVDASDDAPKCVKCGQDLTEALDTTVLDQGHGPKRQAVEKAAEGREQLSEDEMEDATSWFLEEEPEDENERAVKTLEVDVGIKAPRIIRWVVGSLDRERIAAIRREAREQVARRQGRRRSVDPFDDTDEMIANVRIAAEGTIEPDLSNREVRGKYADPADALKAKFKSKSGIIDQIAGAVIRVSGYAADDVQEVDAVKG